MFTVEEILRATGGRLISYVPGVVIEGVSTDSRTLRRGELFVAIKGENYDGHEFIGEAFQKGASLAVISHLYSRYSLLVTRHSIIKVLDTTKALGDIAHLYRMRFDIPVIAITGSNGKTTTKDMIASVLGTRFRVLKNTGTHNNFIGVPLALFQLNDLHQMCVLEMGTNHPGEIKRLAEIASPDIGIITNIGPSHLQYFGDLETVARAKIELFENFKDDMVAMWNADDAMLSSLYHLLSCKKRTFGFSQGADLQAVSAKYQDNCWTFMLNTGELLRLNMPARHNITNALAAVSIGHLFNVEYQHIYEALADFRSPPMRMQIIQFGNITFINDCYNSNPKSMESAIGVLGDFKTTGRKILVSADMLELGTLSLYFHHQLGRGIAASPIDIFIAVGQLSRQAAYAAVEGGMNPDSVWSCDSAKDAGRLLLQILRDGDVVLIKGSRAMKMEEVCSTIYSTP